MLIKFADHTKLGRSANISKDRNKIQSDLLISQDGVTLQRITVGQGKTNKGFKMPTS